MLLYNNIFQYNLQNTFSLSGVTSGNLLGAWGTALLLVGAAFGKGSIGIPVHTSLTVSLILCRAWLNRTFCNGACGSDCLLLASCSAFWLFWSVPFRLACFLGKTGATLFLRSINELGFIGKTADILNQSAVKTLT